MCKIGGFCLFKEKIGVNSEEISNKIHEGWKQLSGSHWTGWQWLDASLIALI